MKQHYEANRDGAKAINVGAITLGNGRIFQSKNLDFRAYSLDIE